MTDRFCFGAKISDALFGQVFQLKTDAQEDNETAAMAIKCIFMDRVHATTSLADRMIDNPFQEKRAMAMLAAAGGHPNVVQFYGHIVEQDIMFLIMEYCPGGDLYNHIRESTYLTERDILAIMTQVLRGVHFLHLHGIMWFMMLTRSPLLPIASPTQKGFSALASQGVGPVFTKWGLSGRISADTIDLITQMLQIDPAKRISLTNVLAHLN